MKKKHAASSNEIEAANGRTRGRSDKGVKLQATLPQVQ